MRDRNLGKLIEDSLNFGAGVFYYSRDRLENFVDEMVAKGEISKYERDDVFQRLSDIGKDQREELESMIRDNIKDYLKLNQYVKKSDLDFYIEEEVKRQIKNLREENKKED